MKAAKIIAPFGVSAVLFILAYLSSKDSGSGFFPIMLLGVGIILALVGTAAIFSNKWPDTSVTYTTAVGKGWQLFMSPDG
jgi:hypothetical protein